METKTRYFCGAEGCCADMKKIGKYDDMKYITVYSILNKEKNTTEGKFYPRKKITTHKNTTDILKTLNQRGENPYPTLFA